MKKLIIYFFGFDLMQVSWGRKFIGGTFYYMETGLAMYPFWSDHSFTNVQGKVLKTETY